MGKTHRLRHCSGFKLYCRRITIKERKTERETRRKKNCHCFTKQMGKFRRSEKDYYYLDSTKRRWERKRHSFPLQQAVPRHKSFQQRIARKLCPSSPPRPGHAGGIWCFVPLPPVVSAHRAPGRWAGAGGTGTGIPHCLQLCCQMCPLLVAPQLRHLRAATSAPPTQILLCCPKDTKDYTKYVTNLHIFSAGRITVSTTWFYFLPACLSSTSI